MIFLSFCSLYLCYGLTALCVLMQYSFFFFIYAFVYAFCFTHIDWIYDEYSVKQITGIAFKSLNRCYLQYYGQWQYTMYDLCALYNINLMFLVFFRTFQVKFGSSIHLRRKFKSSISLRNVKIDFFKSFKIRSMKFEKKVLWKWKYLNCSTI